MLLQHKLLLALLLILLAPSLEAAAAAAKAKLGEEIPEIIAAAAKEPSKGQRNRMRKSESKMMRQAKLPFCLALFFFFFVRSLLFWPQILWLSSFAKCLVRKAHSMAL